MNQSYCSENIQSRIQSILKAPTQKLSKLAQIAGLSLETDYIGVDLSGEDLSNDKLENANLSNANLSNTKLINTALKNVDFRHTDLRGATLVNADLSLANLKGTIIDEDTNIDDKWRLVWNIVNQIDVPRYLKKKDLSFANLNFADLQKTHLEEAIFKGASLQQANLASAALEGADFENADLSQANLTRITVDENTNFRDAKVSKARFGGTFGFPKRLEQSLKARGAIFESVIIDDIPWREERRGGVAESQVAIELTTSSIETDADTATEME